MSDAVGVARSAVRRGTEQDRFVDDDPDAESMSPTRFAATICKAFLITCIGAATFYQVHRHFWQKSVGLSNETIKNWRLELPSVAICPGFPDQPFQGGIDVRAYKLEGPYYGDASAQHGDLLPADIRTYERIPAKDAGSHGNYLYHNEGCVKVSFVDLPEDKKPKAVENFSNPSRLLIVAELGTFRNDTNKSAPNQVPLQFAFYDSMDAFKEPYYTSYFFGPSGSYYRGTLRREVISWKQFWPWQSQKEHMYMFDHDAFPVPAQACELSGVSKGCTMISYEYKSFFIVSSMSLYSVWSPTSLMIFLFAMAVIGNLFNLYNLAFPPLPVRRLASFPLRWLCCGYLSAAPAETDEEKLEKRCEALEKKCTDNESATAALKERMSKLDGTP